MFFKKKIPAEDFGKELGRIFFEKVPSVMFKIDHALSDFCLSHNSYDARNSEIPYARFNCAWISAVSALIFAAQTKSDRFAIRDGVGAVTTLAELTYGIKDSLSKRIFDAVTTALEDDDHYQKTGELQEYDENQNRDASCRRGVSYEIAWIIADECLDAVITTEEQLTFVTSVIVMEVEADFRLAAYLRKQVKLT